MAFDREAAKKAGYTDEEIDAFLQKQAPSTAPTATPAPATPAAAPQNAPQLAPIESTLGALGLGAVKGMASLGHGAKQRWNEAFGDDEDVAADRQAEEKRRAAYQQLFAKHPVAAATGEFGAAVLPAVATIPFTGGASAAPAAAAGARILPALLRGVPRVAAATGAGAASGAAIPVTEAEGGRGVATNTVIGGVGGAVLPAVTAGGRAVKEVVRRSQRALPEEALGDFAGKLGFQGQRTPLATELRKEVTGQAAKVENKFNKGYKDVETAPNLPKVELQQTNAGLAALTGLSDQVNEARSPTLKRMLKAVEEGTGPQSTGLVSASGAPLMKTPTYTFRDIRQMRRDLKSLHRQLVGTRPDDAARVSTAISKVDEDLANWEATHKTGALTKATDLDTQYLKEALPFKEGKLGKFLDSDVANTNLLTDQGEVVADVLNRVPGAKTAMRGLQGAKLAEGTPGARASALSSFPMEGVLSKQEQEYARQLSEALRTNAQGPGKYIDDILVKKLKGLPSHRLARILSGVEEMGYTAPGAPNYIRNAMYAHGLTQASLGSDNQGGK